MCFEIGVPKNFANYTGKHMCQSLYYKKTPIQVFSYEICQIFKKIFFYGTPPMDASDKLYNH